MARRSEISPDDVFAAARRLQVDGKQVTLLQLRNELGSGSFSTIRRHLDAWRDQVRPHSLQNSQVPDSVKKFVDQLWAEAVTIAAQEVDRVQAGANVDIAQAREDLEGALAQIQFLEENQETDQKILESMQKELESAQRKIVELATRNQEMEKRIGDLKEQEQILKQEFGQMRRVVDFLCKDEQSSGV